MTEQERINNEVQIKLASHDEKFNSVMAKVDALIGELRDFKNEMRTQNLLRAKEISELGKKIESAQEKHDADMKAIAKQRDEDMKEINTRIESKFDKLSGQIQNLVIASVVGVGAVVVGVISFVVSVINK